MAAALEAHELILYDELTEEAETNKQQDKHTGRAMQSHAPFPWGTIAKSISFIHVSFTREAIDYLLWIHV